MLSEMGRVQLLTPSPATADRLLPRVRAAAQPRGISTTKTGSLLKRQIPIRTFAAWSDAAPGFFEVDLVAACDQPRDFHSLFPTRNFEAVVGDLFSNVQVWARRADSSELVTELRVQCFEPRWHCDDGFALGVECDVASEQLLSQYQGFSNRLFVRVFVRLQLYEPVVYW